MLGTVVDGPTLPQDMFNALYLVRNIENKIKNVLEAKFTFLFHNIENVIQTHLTCLTVHELVYAIIKLNLEKQCTAFKQHCYRGHLSVQITYDEYSLKISCFIKN